METTTITLELNGETRHVEAMTVYFGRLSVCGIDMTTARGSKTHRGWIALTPSADADHLYTGKDICDIGYHGMRGNGRGQPSNFRYVGFHA